MWGDLVGGSGERGVGWGTFLSGGGHGHFSISQAGIYCITCIIYGTILKHLTSPRVTVEECVLQGNQHCRVTQNIPSSWNSEQLIPGLNTKGSHVCVVVGHSS